MFDTLEDAIFAAAEAARSVTGNKTEAISAIYQTLGGQYGYVEPQGQGKQSKVKLSLKYPKGSRLAALVHNHPGEDDAGDDGRTLFSDTDLALAKQLKLPSYITFGKDMKIAGYTPGVDKEFMKEVPVGSIRKRLPHSAGTPFNHIPEVKVTAQKIGDSALARLMQ